MNINEAIDTQKIGSFQALVVILGFLIIMADGLDVVIMGFIAPQLREEWGVSPQMLGVLFSAALLAQVFGAAISGPLADRFGRKVVVLSSLVWFGGGTAAAAFATDATTLILLRFIAGLGLGAALPNTITLVAEYVPRRAQSFLVNVATCGFTVGAACGGLVAAWIIPAFGWRGVLVFGGVFPLLVALASTIWLPESISFLLARSCDQARARRLVQRLGIYLPETTVLTLSASEKETAGPVRTLLLPRYRFGSIMLWLSYFFVLFAVYLLSSWLPTLIKDGGGYTVSDAAIAAAMFQVGGPAGVLAIGWLMDRNSKTLVIGTALLAGAVMMIGVTQIETNFVMLCVAAALIGFCLNGSAVGMNALAAAFYPTTARATGVSWMTGFGRAGATLSAIAGGLLLGWGWKADAVFSVLSIPVLVCVLAMLLFGRHERRRTETPGLSVASGPGDGDGLSSALATVNKERAP